MACRYSSPTRLVLAALAVALAAGCASQRNAAGPLAGLSVAGEGRRTVERPHDPFVFRSVLDRRPRVVTIALDDEMWVAYDATTGTLYKAWKGGVEFEGAVYTRRHGPQPTTLGANYALAGADGWFVDGQPAQAVYRGYRVDDGRVTLLLEVFPSLISGIPGFSRSFTIEESPEYAAGPRGEPGLLRRFRIAGDPSRLPRNRSGVRTVSVDIDPGRLPDVRTDGEWSPADGGAGRLTLRPERETVLVTLFDAGIVPPAVVSLEDDEGEDEEGDVPALADTSAGELPDEAAFVIRDSEGGVVPLEPGVSIRLYDIQRPMATLPQLVAGQTPNISRVDPVLHLTSSEDFGGIDERVVTHAEGFLAVERAGTYGLRLRSDDGSRMILNGEVAIDHDGLHGFEPADVDVPLARGLHAFEVWHFENEGGQGLSLAWRPPGVDSFETVPTRALRARGGEVRVTAPGRKLLIGALGTRPGDGEPLTDVHPAYDLMTVRPEGFEPRVGGMDFLSDGRLLICTWDPDGAVYILDGVQGDDRSAITVERAAAGLAEPLGLTVVRAERIADGRVGTWGPRRGTLEGDRVFVLQKQELTELIDSDGDEVTDEYRVVSAGWGVTANFHEFAFGLEWMDGEDDYLAPAGSPPGHFYATLATAIDPGGRSTQPQNPDRGRVVQIAPDGAYRFVAAGLRTPNGIGRGAHGRLYVLDNQGDWLPSSKLVVVEEGAFYGNRSVEPVARATTPEVPPVVWLPQNEIGNSPTEPIPLSDGPYAGQMAHGDVTHGGLKRVFVENVDGVWQGAVFRFTQGLEGGINRATVGPDGGIYVGAIGSSGNWGQEGKRLYGLQRLRYAGRPAFEILEMRAMTNGFELLMTEPLAIDVHPDDVEVRQWRYEPTEQYGGPKVDEETLTPRAVTLADNRQRMFVEVDGLQEGHVVYVRLGRPLRSARGAGLWATEAWYTLNRIPANRLGPSVAAPDATPNALTDAERELGWSLLFNGRTLAGFRGYGRDDVPAGWRVEDGAVAFVPGTEGGGGDLNLPGGPYEDFELELEWRVAPCGNSGIFYRGAEGDDFIWRTAPEYQVLDNSCHPDRAYPSHQAGANYDVNTPFADVTRDAGEWNQARLVARGAHVEHWLNGHLVVQYEQGSADWEARVAASKFRDMPGYGRTRRGVIALQDHGDRVWYRSIRIRTF